MTQYNLSFCNHFNANYSMDCLWNWVFDDRKIYCNLVYSYVFVFSNIIKRCNKMNRWKLSTFLFWFAHWYNTTIYNVAFMSINVKYTYTHTNEINGFASFLVFFFSLSMKKNFLQSIQQKHWINQIFVCRICFF